MRRIVRRLQRAQVLASVAVMIVAATTFGIVAFLGGNQREQIKTDAMIDQLQERVVTVGSIHSNLAASNTVSEPQIITFEQTREQAESDLARLKPRIDDNTVFAALEAGFAGYLDALDRLIGAARTGTLSDDSLEKARAAFALVDLASAIREARAYLADRSTSAWNTARVGFAGAITLLVVAVLAITRLTERRLRRALLDEERSRLAHERTRQFGALMENISDTIVVLDATGHVRYVSPAVEQLLGRSPASVVGARLLDALHPDDFAANERALRRIISNGAGAPAVTAVVRARRANGDWAWIEAVATNRQDVPGVEGIVINARDITERRLVEEQLRYHALHDPLTGLVNRTVLTSLVGKALQRSRRNRTSFAVLFIDLDNFKHINDTWGHAVGDELLIGVAERLRSVLRECDTAARQGGDEFVVLLEDISSAGDAACVTERIHEALTLPFETSNRAFSTTASVGVYVSDSSDDIDVDDILRYADIAMYRAKRDGRNRTAFYNPLDITPADRRLALETA